MADHEEDQLILLEVTVGFTLPTIPFVQSIKMKQS